jgi:mevalonate kinase
MIIASAPAKVILFGEHAVVYGEPALAGAIERRVYVFANKTKEKIKITSDNTTIEYREKYEGTEFPYVRKAIELTLQHLQSESGLEIKVNSEIPPASGLGSSASVSVATILAVSKELGADLTKHEIARIGHQVELEVQGAASPTDTATATFGGVLFIQPKKNTFDRIEASIPLVVGYTGIARSTKILVEKVKELRNRYPAIINPIIEEIGEITRTAKSRIERSEDIGELMNINHGLLEALGVSNEKLSELVHIARTAGAGGAKLTGAGGGGCMIAYTPHNSQKVINSIIKRGYTAFDAPISLEGVRLESTTPT